MKRKTATKWTPELDARLRELYPHHFNLDVCRMTGIASESAIASRAVKLGLKKTPEQYEKSAAAGRFKAGAASFNKGKKQCEYMSARAIERSAAGRWKKGNVPANRQPVGSTRLTKEGYIEMKVREGLREWKLLHRHVWEQHNGAIPAGCNIQFRDGNRRNCDIGNLYMISRQEQMKDNSGPLNMPDGIVAKWLSGRGKNREEIASFLANKSLIELKRNQLKLSQSIKNHQSKIKNCYESNQY